MRVISRRGWAQMRQSSGKKREKRAREAVRTTEGPTLATAARLLLEKTHPRLSLHYSRSSGIASDETATIHFQCSSRDGRSSRKSDPVLQRVFKAFQYRDFRLMWIGACTSAIGTWMQMRRPGLADLEAQPLARSCWPWTRFYKAIPIILFSLVGGVLADRFERRHMLIFSQCVQMACAIMLTVLVGFHVVKVWHFLTCSFMVGFAQAFGGPAYSALIPTLVPKEHMPNAIALNSIQFNAAVMVGPALGGWALHSLGETWCFGLNALSFLAPVVSLLMLNDPFPAREDRRKHPRQPEGGHPVRAPARAPWKG